MGKYFVEEEFICPCCGEVHLHQNLIPILDKIRESYGKPMEVTSGWRCKKHNKDVGGVEPSEHGTGEAADVICKTSQDRFQLIKTCILMGIKRIGIGSDFIHIGIGISFPPNVIWLY